MPHFVQDENRALPARLRKGIEALRTARTELDSSIRAMQQMTNDQVAAAYGFSDGVKGVDADTSGQAKDTLVANWTKTMSDGTQAGDAIREILDQFA